MVDRVTNATGASPEEQEAQRKHEEEMVNVAKTGVTNIKDRDSRKEINTDENLTAGDDNTDDNSDDGNKPERPDNIPEKFWDEEKGEVNVEALLKSQQDAEAALRETKKNKEPNESQEGGEEGTDDKFEDAISKSTELRTKASDEFKETGDVSEETRDAITKTGLYTREEVDMYIDGQKAIIANLQNAAFSSFDGSKEAFDKARDWAVENLTEDEIKALDVQITSTNPAIVKQGAQALAAKFKENADIDPEVTVTGDGNGAVTGTYFKSSAEMQAAMNDQRYKVDEAFRQEVAQKIDRAEKAGVNLFS